MWELASKVARSFKTREVNTDSTVFKLHYQVTFCILVVFTITLTAKQFVGKPIRCMHHMGEHEHTDEVLDTFCWIHSTYTVTRAFYRQVGVEVPFPGVDSTRGNEKDIKVFRFYQWVSLCLLFQAILFYVPRWLWSMWEGGKIEALLKMDLNVVLMTEEDRENKKKMMVDYLMRSSMRHNGWALKYFLCEFLALVNVIGQIFLMDIFLDGEFLTYGTEVISFMQRDQEDRIDPMIYIFPTMTKCTFYKFGFSGEVERHDAICILPLNIVNEKIYIFLWFWFIILAILTSILVVYRLFIITYEPFRVFLFTIHYKEITKAEIAAVARNSSFGSWYLLYMIGRNIDEDIFYEAVKQLAIDMSLRHPHHRTNDVTIV